MIIVGNVLKRSIFLQKLGIEKMRSYNTMGVVET